MNTLLIRELLDPFGICRQIGDPMNVHEVLLFENGAPDADDMAYVTCGAESKGQYRHALIIAIGETNIASTHMIQLTGGNVSGVMNDRRNTAWRSKAANASFCVMTRNSTTAIAPTQAEMCIGGSDFT